MTVEVWKITWSNMAKTLEVARWALFLVAPRPFLFRMLEAMMCLDECWSLGKKWNANWKVQRLVNIKSGKQSASEQQSVRKRPENDCSRDGFCQTVWLKLCRVDSVHTAVSVRSVENGKWSTVEESVLQADVCLFTSIHSPAHLTNQQATLFTTQYLHWDNHRHRQQWHTFKS